MRTFLFTGSSARDVDNESFDSVMLKELAPVSRFAFHADSVSGAWGFALAAA